MTYLFPINRLSWLVKVLLMQSYTGHFLNGRDEWTFRSEEALDFKTTPEAMDYSRSRGYREVSIVLKFPKHCDDVELKGCC